ncbi:MAG: DUF2185 domain-containing protein [Oscillospiraceae bacterium]|nr:DUF2185 domain-containing protein [Oscillospiraceae bacterium]
MPINLKKLDDLHWAGKHKEVLEAIYNTPPAEWDYTVICFLARALNGLERYDEALDFLFTVSHLGNDDPLWHFQLGKAYFYLAQYPLAQEEFDRALSLDPDEKQTNEFFFWCRDELQRRNPLNYTKVYTHEELDAVEEHIKTYFGEYPTVFHEIVSTDIHVDICIIPPTPERNYYTLVTLGMGAHRMNIPEGPEFAGLDRTEIVVCLPPDWDVQSNDERFYWPLRWLKTLAHIPIDEDSWLGWGHTVPSDAPFADNTDFSSVLLVHPFAFGPMAESCPLPNGDSVSFYQMVPLYADELEYKSKNGTAALLELMPFEVLEVVNINRRSVCTETTVKCLKIHPDDIEPVLKNWYEPSGCIASDSIMFDGKPIKYMYREQPAYSFTDSGWRFAASPEERETLSNAADSATYSLNTLCNYDPDIMPMLHSPVGTVYVRDKDGVFQLEEFVFEE